TVTTMSAGLDDRNSFDEPMNVVPMTEEVSGLGNRFVYEFPGNAVTFIRLHDARTATSLVGRVAPDTVREDRSATVIAMLKGVRGTPRPTGTVEVTAADGTELASVDVARRLAVHLRVSASDLGVGTHE